MYLASERIMFQGKLRRRSSAHFDHIGDVDNLRKLGLPGFVKGYSRPSVEIHFPKRSKKLVYARGGRHRYRRVRVEIPQKDIAGGQKGLKATSFRENAGKRLGCMLNEREKLMPDLP